MNDIEPGVPTGEGVPRSPFAAVTPEDVEAERSAAVAQLLRFEALPMLGNLIAKAYMSSGYKLPHVEFAALVYWRQALDAPTALQPGGGHVEDVAARLDRLFFTYTRFWIQPSSAQKSDLDEIGNRIRWTGLGVRVPAYPVHQKRILSGLFDPFASELRASLGFDAGDAASVLEHIIDHYNSKMSQFRNDARDAKFQNQKECDSHFGLLGDYLAFTPDDIAALSDIGSAETGNVLRAFALTRGELDEWALTPSPYNVLREQPLLNLGDGRFLAPNCDLLHASIQPRLEHLLNPASGAPGATKGTNDRYLRLRGEWIEDEVARIFDSMMPGGRGTTSYYYHVPDGRFVEGDVIRQVDDAIYIFEEKAGDFSDAAWRGAPLALATSIKETITHGHEQANRTGVYIEAGNREFKDEHDAPGFSLDKGVIREIVPVVVTLAPASIFAGAIAPLQRAGLMPGEPTWVVTLTDLMILAECLTCPGEFRHYARMRRQSLLDERYLALDETDFLGIYLFCNAFDMFPESGQPGDTIVPTFSEAFDDYYALGKKKHPPRQHLPMDLRALILALAKGDAANWTEAVTDLLMLDGDSRDDLANEIRRVSAVRDGRPHDVTVGKSGLWAITLVVGRNESAVTLRERFISGVSHVVGLPPCDRLVIGYDVATETASAEYHRKVGERYFRIPPALFWKSTLTSR